MRPCGRSRSSHRPEPAHGLRHVPEAEQTAPPRPIGIRARGGRVDNGGVNLPGVVRCPSVVGRDAELAAISALLDGAGSGSGGTLMLDGDAGLGKSRLVTEAQVQARAAGIRVGAGRA